MEFVTVGGWCFESKHDGAIKLSDTAARSPGIISMHTIAYKNLHGNQISYQMMIGLTADDAELLGRQLVEWSQAIKFREAVRDVPNI